MVENDKNHGFMLCENSLTEHLVQALNDLLDDPQGEYFIDDNQYTDIALSMITSNYRVSVCSTHWIFGPS
jgi:hypothetical protein